MDSIKGTGNIKEHLQEEVIEDSRTYIGNYVEVQTHPKGQENRGPVIGRIKDGLIKIKTSTNKVIRRLPKSLKK